jgi:hypothetical protein
MRNSIKIEYLGRIEYNFQNLMLHAFGTITIRFLQKSILFKCHACVPFHEMKIKDDSPNVARQLARDFLSIGKFAATQMAKIVCLPSALTRT